jgi:hypothetical protein
MGAPSTLLPSGTFHYGKFTNDRCFETPKVAAVTPTLWFVDVLQVDLLVMKQRPEDPRKLIVSAEVSRSNTTDLGPLLRTRVVDHNAVCWQSAINRHVACGKLAIFI